MTNMPGASEVIQTAQTLSKQEQSVLLIVILIVLGVGFVLLLQRTAKYFMQQHDALLVDHKEARAAYHESLKALVTENHSIMSKLGVHMALNTDALNKCSQELQLFREKLQLR